MRGEDIGAKLAVEISSGPLRMSVSVSACANEYVMSREIWIPDREMISRRGVGRI